MQMEGVAFQAAMGRTVMVITGAVYGLLLVLTLVFFFLYFRGPAGGSGVRPAWALYPAVVCSLVMLAMPLMRIKGYEVGSEQLRVRCAYGDRVFPWQGLKDVRSAPDAYVGAIRTMGNGGVFSMLGHFRSERLGSFRSYVTDTDRLVLLEWENLRVVVSPVDTARFIEVVRQRGMPSA